MAMAQCSALRRRTTAAKSYSAPSPLQPVMRMTHRTPTALFFLPRKYGRAAPARFPLLSRPRTRGPSPMRRRAHRRRPPQATPSAPQAPCPFSTQTQRRKQQWPLRSIRRRGRLRRRLSRHEQSRHAHHPHHLHRQQHPHQHPPQMLSLRTEQSLQRTATPLSSSFLRTLSSATYCARC